MDFRPFLLVDSRTFVDSRNPHGFEIIFQKQMYFVSCFLEVDVFYFFTLLHPALVGIRALTYPGLMANRRDGDHHNNDDCNDVDNIVLTKAEFLDFRDENQQFREKSQQIIGKIKQMIATLLDRKSSHNNNDQYIQ